MIRRVVHGARYIHGRVKHHGLKKVSLWTGGVLLTIMLGLQLIYPRDSVLPFTTVDGVSFGLVTHKAAAISALDTTYSDRTLALRLAGDENEPYVSVPASEMGISVANADRVETVTYPWYWRIVPTSLFWYSNLQDYGDPEISVDEDMLTDFVKTYAGEGTCRFVPHDATIEKIDGALTVKPSNIGGTCQFDDVYGAVRQVTKRNLLEGSLTLQADVEHPDIVTAEADALSEVISMGIADGLQLMVTDDKSLSLTRDQLFDWLTITTTDKALSFTFDTKKVDAYLQESAASDVKTDAGTTVIYTRDFVETGRDTGKSGTVLDTGSTITNLVSVVRGEAEQASVATKAVSPRVTYTRSYSANETGLSALMEQYAKDHAGTYGVALIELSGSYRRAAYNDSTQFTTASTYKLFVAYSTLLRIESGAWKWTDDVVNGQDVSACFDNMIVNSDNDCAHALLLRIGFQEITNEAHALGCNATSFMGNDGIKSTAGDEALFLAQLQTGQLLTQQSSRDRLINAMKRNIYRQGIPAGVNGTVADKVGFLEAWLHDAAIVYAPSGTYVLVIMTENASWASIADLAAKVEALRAR